MNEVLLCKYGEIVLKGANRAYFEDTLCKELRKRAKKCGNFEVLRAQSTVYIEPLDDFCDMDAMLEEAQKVFGIVAIARAYVCEKSMEAISSAAREFIAPAIRKYRTFKVEAKRSDKSFPMQSPEIAREMGAVLLSKFHHLRVNVTNPDIVVMVEIREKYAYIHGKQLPGAGGRTGRSGQDSPVFLGQRKGAGPHCRGRHPQTHQCGRRGGVPEAGH